LWLWRRPGWSCQCRCPAPFELVNDTDFLQRQGGLTGELDEEVQFRLSVASVVLMAGNDDDAGYPLLEPQRCGEQAGCGEQFFRFVRFGNGRKLVREVAPKGDRRG